MDKNKKNLTELSELGEFLLIDKLTKRNKTINKSTLKSVGDDAAVIKYENDELTVVSNDLLVEGIHFDLSYTPLKYVGYKAVSENVSDIFAMNAKPEQIIVSFATSNRFSFEAIDELYNGIYEACNDYGVDLVGGDVASSKLGIMLSITVLGKNKKEKLSYRNGAKTDDLICVSGNLGAAYMGLKLLEREKKVSQETNTTPDWSGYDYILQRQLRPVARKDIFKFFEENNIVPNAMIDISDGLSSEIIHICNQSKKGAIIYEDTLPIHEQTTKMAKEMQLIPSIPAMNGGEDYELLFTIPASDEEKIKLNKQITIIGSITDNPKEIN
ncbi:MAG: thiamine-phosphate kinase, partial [Bacteroidota bacterium]|nr:thiamine-phosphate kinase [Bacteroidota bacterium]